ncbi:GNAT family N-acetyltransferase [Mucilaginibacter antarcticus]|uniref:GNAT family N-acetyltransferase n=1 Tax=Mucilaginibacter antarcticus TaxID=1855725 RepID=A0ABW5XJQ4_9SPHI
MINNNINVQSVSRTQLAELTYISRKTFLDAFAHMNNPDDLTAFLTNHLTNESLSIEMADPNSEFYFAMEDSGPIAYLKVNTGDAQTELKHNDGLEIERIYVLKNHQGKKLGHRLIAEAIKMARQKDKTYVWLGVWERNADAIRFYQHNGFAIFDKHEFKIGNDNQTDLMMKLKLD